MSGVRSIAIVVEGHGEVQAAPNLIRRILADTAIYATLLPPHRLPKTKMPSDLARVVTLQHSRLAGEGGIIVLVDADDDDPEELASRLLECVPEHIRECVGVVVAVREFEAWFLAGIDSLTRHKSVLDNATFDGDPEKPRGAKEKLAACMNESYQETIHQVAFSALVDLDMTERNSASFRLFKDTIIDIVSATQAQVGSE